MTDWQTLAATKRDSILALIPPPWRLPTPLPTAEQQRDVTGKYIQQFLSAREVEITETDAVGILARTTTGKWKAREVTEAFCHRAALAHQLVSCLHEIFFDAAIEDAKRLDEYFEKNGKPLGDLHGLPVSLKDQFHVKDVETTMGYVGWIGTFEGKKGTGKEKVFESQIVTDLRAQGAVLFCKTSVPHTLMSGETINNIIGYTQNPKNRNLSSGGSSGGEGALISLKGSPVGFGTDIGGSIRIPAIFNGLYGIRPSSGRLPYEGMANSMDGQNTILSVVGPLGTSVGALKVGVKGLLAREPWLHDPLVVEMPWRDEQEKAIFDLAKGSGSAKLSFGLMKSDGLVGCHPPVLRALDIVVETVKKLGHEVIEWKPPSHQTMLDIAFRAWHSDGGEDLRNAFALSGETPAPQVGPFFVESDPPLNGGQIAKLNVDKRQFQKDYMEYWNSTSKLTASGRPIDAVICAGAPFAAARREGFHYYGMSTWVNVLDYAATVIPVTTVDKQVDKIDENYKPLDETDELVWKCYDPEIYDGANVGVQLVGRRFQEEKILALTQIIGDALEKNVV